MFLCQGVLAAVDGARIEVQGVVAGRTEVMESVGPQVGQAAARTARQAGSCYLSALLSARCLKSFRCVGDSAKSTILDAAAALGLPDRSHRTSTLKKLAGATPHTKRSESK